MKIKNIRDLAEERCASGNTIKELKQSITRNVYKYTECGAWIEFTKGKIRIGSIVEGVEQCAEPVTLEFPFTSEEYDNAIQNIEDQCKEIWNDTHGCEDCGGEDPETGYTPINPDCKTCDGEGVII